MDKEDVSSGKNDPKNIKSKSSDRRRREESSPLKLLLVSS